MNKKPWLRLCRTKAQDYLSMHELPTNPLVKDTKQQTTQQNSTQTNNNYNKYRYKHNNNNDDNDNNDSNDNQEGHNERWPQQHNGIKIIVDSKQLCDTINGTAALEHDNPTDHHHCNNITNNLVKLHHM